MSVAYGILGILGTGPNYGYKVKRLYDTYFHNEKQLAYGQVYATLARLKRDGKVQEAAQDQQGGPERTKYAITLKGLSDLETWLAAPETQRPSFQSTVFSKVVSAILLDKDPHVFLDAQKASHIARMRELTQVRRAADIATSLQADLEIFHLEADLRWIDVTLARLQTLTREVRV